MHFRQAFHTTAFLFASRLTARAIAAFTIILLINYAGAEQYGMYATALALIDFFLLFNDFGMPQLLLREGSRDPKTLPVYFGNTIFIESVFTIIVFSLMLLVAHLFNYSWEVIRIVLILGAANFIFEHRKICRSILRMVEKLKMLAVFELSDAVLTLCGIWLVAQFLTTDPSERIMGFSVIQLFINILLIVFFFIYTLRLLRPSFSLKKIVPMIKESYLFSLSTIFFAIYFQIDQIVISKIQGTYEVGIYSAPLKLIMLLLIIPQLIFQVIQPLMYRLAFHDREKYKRIHITLLRYLSAFGVGTGMILWLLAEPIMKLLFHTFHAAEIQGGTRVLQVFAIFHIFAFISTAAEYGLTTLDKIQLKAKLRIGTVFLNLALDILFVYWWGFIGAAYATLIVQIIISFLFIHYDGKYLGESWKKMYRPLLPIFFSGLLLALFIFLLQDRIHVMLLASLGIVTYFLFLWSLRFFGSYDIKLLKQLIPKKYASTDS